MIASSDLNSQFPSSFDSKHKLSKKYISWWTRLSFVCKSKLIKPYTFWGTYTCTFKKLTSRGDILNLFHDRKEKYLSENSAQSAFEKNTLKPKVQYEYFPCLVENFRNHCHWIYPRPTLHRYTHRQSLLHRLQARHRLLGTHHRLLDIHRPHRHHHLE